MLSIVVVAYDMPTQLARTLYTLSADHQRNVDPEDYEVIVVENRSAHTLERDELNCLNGNFRYRLREEPGLSPVHALNEGIAQARGAQVGIMIDGAHMLTPRVLEMALAGARAFPNHLIGVPVRHLGCEEQNRSAVAGFDEGAQDRLLASVDWRADGYELLRISVWCGANPHGFMQPMMESNCFFVPRENLRLIGGADPRFNDAGGGSLNLHLYRALGLIPDSAYLVLQGEASFHQFHGGITSGAERTTVSARFRAELETLWQGGYRALTREPIYFGSVSPQAQAVLSESSLLAERRFERLARSAQDPWPESAVKTLNELPFLERS
ncbi:MAG: glycosyltransferase family A protein [Pseudomonadota bacterium]